MYVTSYAGEYW